MTQTTQRDPDTVRELEAMRMDAWEQSQINPEPEKRQLYAEWFDILSILRDRRRVW